MLANKGLINKIAYTFIDFDLISIYWHVKIFSSEEKKLKNSTQ